MSWWLGWSDTTSCGLGIDAGHRSRYSDSTAHRRVRPSEHPRRGPVSALVVGRAPGGRHGPRAQSQLRGRPRTGHGDKSRRAAGPPGHRPQDGREVGARAPQDGFDGTRRPRVRSKQQWLEPPTRSYRSCPPRIHGTAKPAGPRPLARPPARPHRRRRPWPPAARPSSSGLEPCATPPSRRPGPPWMPSGSPARAPAASPSSAAGRGPACTPTTRSPGRSGPPRSATSRARSSSSRRTSKSRRSGASSPPMSWSASISAAISARRSARRRSAS